jgi:hypothetical protein
LETVREVIRRIDEIGLACPAPRWAGGRPGRLGPDGEASSSRRSPRARPGSAGPSPAVQARRPRQLHVCYSVGGDGLWGVDRCGCYSVCGDSWDRLDTDIEGANNGGADSLLVLTGVTDARTLLAAPPRHRPTYVAKDLNGLLTPHEGVRQEGGRYVCGGWTVDGGQVTGDGDPMDGLRALCTAVWDSGDVDGGTRALDGLAL